MSEASASGTLKEGVRASSKIPGLVAVMMAAVTLALLAPAHAIAGTTLVKDIYPGASSSFPGAFAELGGIVYFSAEGDFVTGRELWKSDGTAAGTTLVKNINPDTYGDSFAGVGGAATKVGGPLGDVLLFAANGGTSTTGTGVELWRSDGTESGTVLVRDIVPGSGSSDPTRLTEGLTTLGSTLFFAPRCDNPIGAGGSGFACSPPDQTYSLWRSNGTAVDTVSVGGGTCNREPRHVSYLTPVGGTLFFAAHGCSDVQDRELWRSNGTGLGTTVVKDINPGKWNWSSPAWLTNVGGTLFFSANDGTNGYELWKSNGTTSGTTMVKNINPGSSNSYPSRLTNVNGTLFFTANDGTNGEELWKSDGTSAGTTMVKNINPGSASSSPLYLNDVGGTLFFRANDGTNGEELWKSDGTSAGTTMVKDINPGSASSTPGSPLIAPGRLLNVGGTLYFSADDGTHGSELWQSDGTTAGTTLVYDINPGSANSYPSFFAGVGGNTLFFSANDGTNGKELWKSD